MNNLTKGANEIKMNAEIMVEKIDHILDLLPNLQWDEELTPILVHELYDLRKMVREHQEAERKEPSHTVRIHNGKLAYIKRKGRFE